MWFLIRINNSIKDGSRHLFEAIRLSRYLPPKYRTVVDASIAHNAFFAFPENVLLSMMTDPRSDIRKEALDKILKARDDAAENHSGAVHYIVPTLNFQANEYYEMIDWTGSNVSITSPPVIRNMTNEELVARLSDTELLFDWEFSKFPCHTVAVERMVKLVTEASASVCGKDSRERFIRSTLQSRTTLPKFDTKAQYVSVMNSGSESE